MSKPLVSGRCPICRVCLCAPNSPLCKVCQSQSYLAKCSSFFPGVCAACKVLPRRSDFPICEECYILWTRDRLRCPACCCLCLTEHKEGCLCDVCEEAYEDMMVSTFLPGKCAVCKTAPREMGYTMCNNCFVKWRSTPETMANCPNCHKPRGDVRSALCAVCEKACHEIKVTMFLPGLCAACKVNPHVIGYTLCDVCFRWWTETGRKDCPNCHQPRGDVDTALCAVCEKGYQDMKARILLPGKCAACKINPPKKGFTLCKTCFSIWRKHRDICPVCGKPRGDATTALCSECHNAVMEMNRTTFIPGRCAACKVDPNEDGFTLCRACVLKWKSTPETRMKCPNCHQPRGDVRSALCATCERGYYLAMVSPPPPARVGPFVKGRCARCKTNPVTRDHCDLCDRCYKFWASSKPVCAVCLKDGLGPHPHLPKQMADLCAVCRAKWDAEQSLAK